VSKMSRARELAGPCAAVLSSAFSHKTELHFGQLMDVWCCYLVV